MRTLGRWLLWTLIGFGVVIGALRAVALRWWKVPEGDPWLEASVAGIRVLRERGIPILGYTWFPLFTMIDWKYRFGRGPVEEYRLDLGLYTLRNGGAPGRWAATPLVEQFRSYVSDPESAIGNIGVPAA